MYLDEALAAYERQAVANGRSHHSILQSRRHVRALSNWLASEGRSLGVAELGHSDIADFMGSDQALLRPDGKRKKPVSVNGLRSSLRTFFGYAHAAGMTTSNAARLLRRAVCSPPPPRALSPAEQEKLIAELDRAKSTEERRDRICFLLMLRTGLRVGSVVALDVSDIDIVAGVMDVSLKRDRRERVFVSRALREELRTLLDVRGQGAVFVGARGERLTTRHVQRTFARLRERAGLPTSATCHSLRHSFGSDLLNRTGDLELVRRAMCHASIAATTIYARCGDQRLREAVGA